MDSLDFVNKSLRLRYEALSRFATDINQAKSMEAIGTAITSNIKFLIDAFILRLSIKSAQGNYTIEMYRAKCSIYQNHYDQLTPYENECISNGIPLSLDKKDIVNSAHLQNSIFKHPKATHLLILPIETSADQKLILFSANKSAHPYNEIDFYFANLISEMLATKSSQLLLIQKIGENYKALAEANHQLSELNEEITTLNNELELKVQERTQKLSEAHHELNTLFYRTSHDFRRPLSAMLGLINLMEMDKGALEVSTYAQHLKTSVNELDQMLTKLQTISLTQVDDDAVERISFERLINTLKEKFEDKLAVQNILFTAEVQVQHHFYTHSIALEAILTFLIENSIDYCCANSPFVRLNINEQKNHLIIQVQDNGDGILEKYKDKVFDMYTKASERSTGNGLGLYIAKKLVEKLSGKISLQSSCQQGSTFTLTIPYPENYKQLEKFSKLTEY